MNVERTWLTCSEVAKILNFTQRHILNLIKKGKISAERDVDGRYYIEKSEFFRVYPNALPQEKARTDKKSLEPDSTKFLEEKIIHLQEMIEEKNRHNEFLSEQLRNFTEEKSKMLDAINNHARLLEYKETIQCSKTLKWKWPFRRS